VQLFAFVSLKVAYLYWVIDDVSNDLRLNKVTHLNKVTPVRTQWRIWTKWCIWTKWPIWTKSLCVSV